MHYYLYKLKFPYGVHFGADKTGTSLDKIFQNCHCDTLYSAVCHEIIKLDGEEKLKDFYKATLKGQFLFSDLLPYVNDELLIPKPVLYVERNEEKQVSDSVQKKKIKKLQFIPVTRIKQFFDGEAESIDFAENVLYEKNAIARDGGKENGLYSVAVTRFKDNCGLYFVVRMEETQKDWFDKIMKSLCLSGIGGKRTSGYGQFEVIDDIEVDEKSGIESERILAALLNKDAEFYLSLSAFYPKQEEIKKLKNGYYSLIQRQGFIQSATYNNNKEKNQILKKRPITMINAGSCFREKFDGQIVDVKKDGSHSVYRYGKPIMIGIDL